MLDVSLSSVITRNLRTSDTEPVIAELHALAGNDVELLREVAGLTCGYYRDAYSETLCAALEAQIDGLEPWIELGRRRRARGVHGGPEQRSTRL